MRERERERESEIESIRELDRVRLFQRQYKK